MVAKPAGDVKALLSLRVLTDTASILPGQQDGDLPDHCGHDCTRSKAEWKNITAQLLVINLTETSLSYHHLR